MVLKEKEWWNRNIIRVTMGVVIVLIIATNFYHKRYSKPDRVIEWDVKSYYGYLPAVFIYKDLSFQFRKDDPDKFGDLVWPFETHTGKLALRTTMAMSFLYTPFFALGHTIALLTDYEADGYSAPYRFALTFSALFYVWMGMIFLSKALMRLFRNKWVVSFTLFTVVVGTNLFYYATYEAPMTHVYSFAFIAVFLWVTIRFYDRPSWKNIIIPGLLAGFIALIRPTNIIVLLLFFLWDIKSWNDFTGRFLFFIRRFHWVLLMAISFIVVWIPQFVYWYDVSGQIFYFTYGEKGDGFFWHNPQIWNILVSYKKGWFVYTPIMLIGFVSIFFLPKKLPGLFIPILIYKLLNIYILSSWWSWWFGGGFGLRAFIESYAVMAIPLAVTVNYAFTKANWQKYIITAVFVVLIFFNQFQILQYKNNAIHWWWMNKEAYWETFLKLRPTERFWYVITTPDYEAARKGIYRELKSSKLIEAEKKKVSPWKDRIPEDQIIDWMTEQMMQDSIFWKNNHTQPVFTSSDSLKIAREEAGKRYREKGFTYWEKQMAMDLIIKEITGKPNYMEYLRKKAEENNNPLDSQIVIDAQWLFENERLVD